jgi:hypothetical protein
MSENTVVDNVIDFPEINNELQKTEVGGQTPIDFSKFPQVRNRKEARALEKVLRKTGKSDKEISDLIQISKMVTKAFASESLTQSKQYLDEGGMVKLNADKMWSYPDWDKRQKEYKDFVKENINTIFIVKYLEAYRDKPNIVTLIDEAGVTSPWSFADDDLLVYDEAGRTFKEMWLIEEKVGESI